jgi:hypothetical protein
MFKRHKIAIVLVLISCGFVSAAATKLVRNYLAYRRATDYRVLDRSVTDERFELTLLSAPYHLDQIYKSMQGPCGNQPRLRLAEGAPLDETLYLTGIDSQIVDAESLEPTSNEFYCHSSLTFCPETTSPEKHNASFPVPRHNDWRLFTLVPGRWTIRLPDGFGIPIKNATDVDFFTMSLNQNPGLPPRTIRMRTTITGRRAGANLRPLFRRVLCVYQQHADDQSKEPAAADPHVGLHQGAQCAADCKRKQLGSTPSRFGSLTAADKPVHPGQSCCVSNASAGGIQQRFGKNNTIHWMVPPGRHVYRTEVTPQLNLPFSTKIHYATGHLHPFGKSVRLVDMETGKTVCEIESRDRTDRLGVEWMSEVTSREGIAIGRKRRYELVAEYDNTSSEPIDAMAILYFYALDEAPANGG